MLLQLLNLILLPPFTDVELQGNFLGHIQAIEINHRLFCIEPSFFNSYLNFLKFLFICNKHQIQHIYFIIIIHFVHMIVLCVTIIIFVGNKNYDIKIRTFYSSSNKYDKILLLTCNFKLFSKTISTFKIQINLTGLQMKNFTIYFQMTYQCILYRKL